MTEPVAFLDGRILPASQIAVPVWDAGFVQGVTVAEQMRTFGGRLFRLEHHLERLADSLRVVGVEVAMKPAELQRIALEVVAHNHRLLVPGDDLGLSLFVTPGPYAAFAPADVHGPTIGMHTYPVPFATFADKYSQGQRLIVSDTRQIPGTCWPPSLKCRSRMHYFLADREAKQKDSAARALLLDQEGFVSEASSANFVLYRRDRGFLSPRLDKILPGISVAVLDEFARQMGIPFLYQDLTLDDVRSADEAYLSSTSPCLLPVVAVDGVAIGDAKPGPIFHKAIFGWNQLVGLDIVDQAMRFRQR